MRESTVSDRSALLVAVFAAWLGLAGVVWSTTSQLSASREQQSEQFDEARNQDLRDLRRPVYSEFLDAANAYAVAHTRRQEECKVGTDIPAVKGQPCTVGLMTKLQSARFDFQGAINRMESVESTEADRAAGKVTAALPPSLPLPNSAPAEGPVNQVAFRAAYVEFIDVMRCDTNPTDPCQR